MPQNNYNINPINPALGMTSPMAMPPTMPEMTYEMPNIALDPMGLNATNTMALPYSTSDLSAVYDNLGMPSAPTSLASLTTLDMGPTENPLLQGSTPSTASLLNTSLPANAMGTPGTTGMSPEVTSFLSGLNTTLGSVNQIMSTSTIPDSTMATAPTLDNASSSSSATQYSNPLNIQVTANMQKLASVAIAAADDVRYQQDGGNMGWCAKGVNAALSKAGFSGVYADAGGWPALMAKDSRFQEISVPKDQIASLPPGCIVTETTPSGGQHVFITTGNGGESSDWHGGINDKDPLIHDPNVQIHVYILK